MKISCRLTAAQLEELLEVGCSHLAAGARVGPAAVDRLLQYSIAVPSCHATDVVLAKPLVA